MISRKFIFYLCIIFSIALFGNGLYYLNSVSNHRTEKPDSNYNPINFIGWNAELEEKSTRSFNLLAIGLDEEEVRADVIALLNYSPERGEINVLSIARDTRVKSGKRYVKANALVGIGGEKLVAEKVEEITGLSVDYYLTMNFKGFRQIVDILGGVEIDVPFDMDYDDPEQNLHIHLKKGKQLLDGLKSEQFVRYRKGNRKGEGYTDGDIGRIQAQQQFIRAFIEQKLKFKYILKVDEIFSILKDNLKTNIEIGDLNYFLKSTKNINIEEVNTYTLPGSSDYINKQWYYIYNKKETKELIDNIFSK